MSTPHVTARISQWLLPASVAIAALAIGAIHTTVLEVVVVMLAVAAVAGWWNAKPLEPRSSATLVLLVLVVLTLVTTLQCVPLPRSLVATVSPHAADVWRRAFRPFGEDGPAVHPLSLDPNATRIEVLRGVALILAFLATMVSGRVGSLRLQRTLVAAGVAVIVIAAIHYAFEARLVYGIYKPRTGVGVISPFLNGNHLSAYGNIALIVAYASLIAQKPMFPRPILIAVIAIVGASDLFWASRGAVATAVIGILVATLLTFRDRMGHSIRVAVPVIVALAGGAMLMLAMVPFSLRELSDTDLSKFQIARQVLVVMSPAYALVGTGRGAFESTFPEFRTGSGFLVWTHPENLVAEWVSGWGIPTAIFAFCALGYALRPRSVVSKDAIGPWVAVIVVALHNLVDFSLEIPAVGIALVVCVGIVTRGHAVARRGWLDAWAKNPRAVAWIAGVVAFVALVSSATVGEDLIADRAAVQVALRDQTLDVIALRERLHGAMARHPAEPYFAYAGAVAASRTGDNVVPWLEHTLERAPVYPPAHLILARRLRRTSKAQARLEYRLYAEQFGGQPLDVREVDGLIASYEDVGELTPKGTPGDELLEALSPKLRDRLPATSSRIDAELARRNPNSVGPVIRFAEAHVADLAEPWCTQQSCFDEATAAAIHVETLAPTRCEGYVLHSKIELERHDVTRALGVLAQATNVVSQRADCDAARAAIAIAANRYDEASAAIDALVVDGCDESPCITNLLRAADLESKRGSRTRALIQLQRAAALAPDDDSVAERVAYQASVVGAHRLAAKLYRNLATRHPGESRFAAAASSEAAVADQP